MKKPLSIACACFCWGILFAAPAIGTEKGPASGTPDLNAQAADPNVAAKAKLEAAIEAINAGNNAKAMDLLGEVHDMPGLSPRYRAKTDTWAAEVGLRIQSWKVVKAAAERALATHAADPEDEEHCKELLKKLRQLKPEMFK